MRGRTTLRRAGVSAAAVSRLSQPFIVDDLMVLTGIAEFARELICERTRARREVGKRRGVRFGRPAEMSIARRDLAVRFLAN